MVPGGGAKELAGSARWPCPLTRYVTHDQEEALGMADRVTVVTLSLTYAEHREPTGHLQCPAVQLICIQT